MRREWIEIETEPRKPETRYRLPPCGGSGLKCLLAFSFEMWYKVSLHAEGVD